MKYYLIVTQGSIQFALEFNGQTLKEIEAMLPTTYPGCSWQAVDEATYLAFLEAHRITV